MQLHERLNSQRQAPVVVQEADGFAEVKNRIHMAVIGELGPQFMNSDVNPAALRARVLTDIRERLGHETGIARDDRERLVEEIADDTLGHGPLERFLADESITEVMVNGPNEVWIERQGRLTRTPVRFTDDSHLRRIINKIVAQVGRRVDHR
jgi:pilus assembly protein CpaF